MSEGIVLLVEDNEKLNDANARVLRLRGYEVHTALTLAEARDNLTRNEPDVILLDVMLPDGSGFDFCAEIRDRTRAHILFLTAKTEHADRVRGLTAGGDDYIMKPFHPEELMARVAAAMRRRGMTGPSTQVLARGSLTLDVVASQAFVHGSDLLLQPKEFALLLLLVQNEGQVLGAEQVYEKIWRQPMVGDKNALQAAVYRLRKKIEHTGYDIRMVRGKGYLFEKS